MTTVGLLCRCHAYPGLDMGSLRHHHHHWVLSVIPAIQDSGQPKERNAHLEETFTCVTKKKLNFCYTQITLVSYLGLVPHVKGRHCENQSSDFKLFRWSLQEVILQWLFPLYHFAEWFPFHVTRSWQTTATHGFFLSPLPWVKGDKVLKFCNMFYSFILCVGKGTGEGGCVCHAEAGGQLARVTSLHLPCGSRNNTQAVKFRGRHLYPLSHLADPRRIDFFSFKNIVGITNTGCNKHNPSWAKVTGRSRCAHCHPDLQRSLLTAVWRWGVCPCRM